MRLPSLDSVPIRLRLTIGYVVLVIVTVAVVGVSTLIVLESNLRRSVDDALRLRASRITRELDPGPAGRLDAVAVSAALSSLAPQDEFAEPGIFVQIRDRDGTVLASSPNLPLAVFDRAQASMTRALAGQPDLASIRVGDFRVRVLAVPIIGGGEVVGIALLGESLHPLDVTFQQVQQILVLASAGIAVLALVGGWWLTSRALGPVAAVTRGARQISVTGQFDQRIPSPAARDELGDLTATFNDMLSRIEMTLRRQREFLADASHELRGPLTVIRGNLDLLKMDLPEGEREECVREASAEVARMARLVSDLLFLAEADTGETVAHEEVALDQVVYSTWQRARAVDGGMHQVNLESHDAVTIRGDAGRLDQLVWNLVENALRYTPPGGTVTLAVRDHGSVAEIVVADTGIGIPAEHLPRIFERFYRVDRARSRAQGSSGLGLAIVKQIAEAHGGQVRVRSEPGKGSIFSVVLPTTRARHQIAT
jgi:two-component system OmpR family sensor kinase